MEEDPVKREPVPASKFTYTSPTFDSWKREADGHWYALQKTSLGEEYRGMVHFNQEIDGWCANLIFMGGLIHISEQMSRDEAIEAVHQALQKALKLRERWGARWGR